MKALILLLLALSTCQAMDVSISGHASGNGSIDSSLETAQALIQQDHGGNVRDWSFNLAFHNFDIPTPGTLILNNTTYRVAENGSLIA